jgi:hypothetical protein
MSAWCMDQGVHFFGLHRGQNSSCDSLEYGVPFPNFETKTMVPFPEFHEFPLPTHGVHSVAGFSQPNARGKLWRPQQEETQCLLVVCNMNQIFSRIFTTNKAEFNPENPRASPPLPNRSYKNPMHFGARCLPFLFSPENETAADSSCTFAVCWG